MPRPRLSGALLLCVLWLAPACGDGAPDDLRIYVETLSIDGELPRGLRAVLLSATGEGEASFDLVPVADGAPGEHAIRGGQEGRYRVEGPDGWGMVSRSVVPPEVARNRTPPRVRLGRPGSLYLGPVTATLRPSTRWGAERVLPDGGRERVDVTVEVEPPGWVVALRFPADVWEGVLQVVGYLDARPIGVEGGDGVPGPLAEPLRVSPPAGGGPVVGQLRIAPMRPLDVIPVPAGPAAGNVEGLVVRARLPDLPLEVVYEERVHEGAARFPFVPTLGGDVEVTVGENALGFGLEAQAWDRSSEMRILWTGAGPQRTVRIAVPPSVAVDRVQVRPAAARAFGRVPFEQGEDGVVLSAPPGSFSLLLAAGTRWAYLADAGGGEGALTLDAPPFAEGVAIEGGVRGARPGCVVRFFRQVGEEAVLGDGFVLRTAPAGGTYEALLPPGTYLVETEDAAGTWRREMPVEVETPGTRVHLPLRAPGR